MDDKPSNFPSNIQLHNYDISTLFIETRGWMCKLMLDAAQKSGSLVKTYYRAAYYYIQLFESSRHMIRKSGKIDDWDNKEKLYMELTQRIINNDFIPEILTNYWRALCDDIVAAGLYNSADDDWAKNILKLLGG